MSLLESGTNKWIWLMSELKVSSRNWWYITCSLIVWSCDTLMSLIHGLLFFFLSPGEPAQADCGVNKGRRGPKFDLFSIPGLTAAAAALVVQTWPNVVLVVVLLPLLVGPVVQFCGAFSFVGFNLGNAWRESPVWTALKGLDRVGFLFLPANQFVVSWGGFVVS